VQQLDEASSWWPPVHACTRHLTEASSCLSILRSSWSAAAARPTTFCLFTQSVSRRPASSPPGRGPRAMASGGDGRWLGVAGRSASRLRHCVQLHQISKYLTRWRSASLPLPLAYPCSEIDGIHPCSNPFLVASLLCLPVPPVSFLPFSIFPSVSFFVQRSGVWEISLYFQIRTLN